MRLLEQPNEMGAGMNRGEQQYDFTHGATTCTLTLAKATRWNSHKVNCFATLNATQFWKYSETMR